MNRCQRSRIVWLRNKLRNMTSPESIGQRIKRERLARNMTQLELADQVGVGVPHISKVETDRENPSDDLLTRIAKVFDLKPDELLLVARRLPDDLVDALAADPERALEFLRKFDPEKKATQ